jgi:hypothetical protein
MKMPQEIRVSFIYDKDTTPDGPVLLTISSRFRNWSEAGYNLWKNIRQLIREHAIKVEKLEGREMYVHATDIENALLGIDGIPFEPIVRSIRENKAGITEEGAGNSEQTQP